jgi:branched-chain amino acid transport system ATP-binding protein
MDKQESQHLLEVNNIEVVYNDIIQVLRGVSLNVSQGGIVALLGTNGAGKTTTLRAISGLLKPENGFIRDGYIKFGGSDITNVLGTQVVKLGAIMVPEGRRVFKHLTVEENIRVGSITRKDGSQKIRADNDKMYDHFPRLSKITHRLAGYCSGGEQQMIAIARALMAAPKMLMLDEPSLGWRRCWSKRFSRNVETINRELGTTILVVEQNAKIACRCPIMPTSWSPAKSSWKARPRNSRTTRMSKSSTWASPRAADEILQRSQVL